MHKDLNEKINIDIEKPNVKEVLEKYKDCKNTNISNISTKETTEISSETEESFLEINNIKKNMIKEESKNEKKEAEKEIYNSMLKEKMKKRKVRNKKSIKYESYKSEYLPNKNNMNIKAPKVPINYNQIFNIDKNKKQKDIGEKEYMKDIYKEKYERIGEFKQIDVIPHEKLLHLFTNEDIHNINKSKETYNKISITERFKHKFLTTVYFFPKK